MVRPETAARLLTAPEPLVAGFADACLVIFDGADVPAATEPVPANRSVADWQGVVCRLLASRGEATRIIRLSAEAGEILAGVAAEVAEAYKTAPAEERRYLDHLPRQIAKVAQSLYISTDAPGDEITGDAVKRSVAHVQLATKHRLAILEVGRAEPASKVLRAAVRAKIVAFGPLLSPRDIRRHFHALKNETLMPVLHDLVQADEIVKEQDGTYSAPTRPQLQIVGG